MPKIHIFRREYNIQVLDLIQFTVQLSGGETYFKPEADLKVCHLKVQEVAFSSQM